MLVLSRDGILLVVFPGSTRSRWKEDDDTLIIVCIQLWNHVHDENVSWTIGKLQYSTSGGGGIG
jgi:hypothetical protein